ncbi:MAG TPA: hypothetical protein VLM37_10835 [Fibrobacteraceae bacterium]|nr:hypothetical protein [Fibrobacteraceae bacterium]
MDATVVDLRYRMSKVLQALGRREEVRVLYHGKPRGKIIPLGASKVKAAEHPFFGSAAKNQISVDEVMDQLRGGRFRDL